MRKLESFSKEIFNKEEMKKVQGGLAAPTKTSCDGTTTTVNGQTVLDCGDSDKVD